VEYNPGEKLASSAGNSLAKIGSKSITDKKLAKM
jgi:hypothetical protein